MTTPQTTSKLILTNINEARLIKRSQTNSLLTFKPIRLKSLQEARNELKSTSSRTLSHTSLDLRPPLLSNFSSTQCTSQNISPIKPLSSRIQTKPKSLSQTSKPVTENRGTNKKCKIFYKKNEGSKRKGLNGSLEAQKKLQGRVGAGRESARVSSVSGSSGKASLSISDVLKIVENVIPNERPTPGHGKGLTSRLQHKKVLKFLPKMQTLF